MDLTLDLTLELTLDLALDLALDWSLETALKNPNLRYTGFKGFIPPSDNLSLDRPEIG